jgi:hypothetical protein
MRLREGARTKSLARLNVDLRFWLRFAALSNGFERSLEEFLGKERAWSARRSHVRWWIAA